jgi:hypothetical protein
LAFLTFFAGTLRFFSICHLINLPYALFANVDYFFVIQPSFALVAQHPLNNISVKWVKIVFDPNVPRLNFAMGIIRFSDMIIPWLQITAPP